MSKNNIWYLPGPFHQYQEDVKALAKEAGLVIVDANAAESRKGEAKDVPEVSIRPEMRAVEPEPPALGDESTVQALRANLESVSRTLESFVDGGLQGFGDSEIAVRLFQVLDSVNSGVQSLRRERDGEIEKVAKLEQDNVGLLKQIESLKSSAPDPEVETLKAALDKAGVVYRANASKESLQKLVDELDKK